MSDDDQLKDDPDAKAIQPMHSKRTLVLATAAGAVFGLMLAIAGYIFEQYTPRFTAPPPDAGAPFMPDIALEDAGANDTPSPWLQD